MKLTLRCLLLTVLGIAVIQAQKTGSPSSGTSGAGGGTAPAPITTPSPGSGSNSNSNVPPQQPAVPTNAPSRPIFISGTVVADDGSPLPGSVEIQSICGGGTQRNVAHAAGNGNFAFQWNDTTTVFQDASTSSQFSLPQTSPMNVFTALDPTSNCELRASLSGYTSSRVTLGDHSMATNIDVGNIVLHRLTGDEGRTVSLTALKAPKNAVKSFDKGTAEVRAHKLPDAAVSFQKALAVYPGYADALLSLGKVEIQTGAKEAANSHFHQAMDLDSKMSGPWEQLGYMASDESKWADAAKFLDEAIRLDPTGSPMAWYFDGVANYNLGRFDAAERSVRAGIRLNGDRNPRAQYLLGLVLVAKKDLAGGADVLRKYIEKWPQSGDVDAARQQLGRIGSQISMSGPQ